MSSREYGKSLSIKIWGTVVAFIRRTQKEDVTLRTLRQTGEVSCQALQLIGTKCHKRSSVDRNVYYPAFHETRFRIVIVSSLTMPRTLCCDLKLVTSLSQSFSGPVHDYVHPYVHQNYLRRNVDLILVFRSEFFQFFHYQMSLCLGILVAIRFKKTALTDSCLTCSVS